jgi:Zn-finger nucleic acid-binding protein
MFSPLLCAKCGAPLPSEAAFAVTTCAFCGTSSSPAPKVVERIVDRVVVVAAQHSANDAAATPCPRCATTMSLVSGGGEQAPACAKCGGVWLSTRQMDALRKGRNEDFVRSARRVAAVFMPLEPRQALLLCPTCRGALRVTEIEGSVHLMHVCDTHGALFERDAIDTFMAVWTEKRAGEVDPEDLEALGLKRKGFFGFF